MTTEMLAELLALRSTLDGIIKKYPSLSRHGCDTTTPQLLATAAAAHPNPAPAAPLMAAINLLLPQPQGPRRLSQLLQAHGYRKTRGSTGASYWRPNAPEPSTHEQPDPEPQQDR